MITFRRYYLDQFLKQTSFSGKVLDIGGKKVDKRGNFRPPIKEVESWEYLNSNPSTNPDFNCNAEKIPVAARSYDMVVMTEVLEHLLQPDLVLKECARVLKYNGQLVVTIPFLYPIHADPHDFQRWTPEKIRLEFERAGFILDKIEAMGSIFAVICDLIHVALGSASKNPNAFINRAVRKLIMSFGGGFFLWLDKIYANKSSKITTGFYILAKNDSQNIV